MQTIGCGGIGLAYQKTVVSTYMPIYIIHNINVFMLAKY